MKVSLRWLNTMLEPAVDAREAARLLSVGGFPVENTLPVGNDTMLDVEVTSNRPDVLSHVGVAREIAARSPRALKAPACAPPNETGPFVSSLINIENRAGELCPLYTARVITGVKIGPSPDWLVQALQTVGQRSVNNVVDVTNYVLLELGQPMHAFDLARLADKKIIVRRATQGERFEAIDHSKHTLQDDMLVIADGRSPVALAGVMGGADSEVTSKTTDLLIESAMFDELTVRRASRKLKLFSDSSFRFERGVDPLGVEAASRRCCELILKVAGGTLARGVIRAGRDEPEPRVLKLRTRRTCELLGIELSPQQQAKLLGALGIVSTLDLDGKTLTTTVPSFRLDLVREIDLIEEIARQHGLANIPTQTKINIIAHHPQNKVEAKRTIVQTLVSHGYHETVTPSLITAADAGAFVDETQAARLVGDMRRADNTLRPSPLPSLLSCRKLNQDAGNRSVKLFELAGGWTKDGSGKIVERRRLTLLCDAEDAQPSLREVRGTIEELLQALAGELADRCTVSPSEHADFAVAGEVKLEGKSLGNYGLISGKLTDHFGLQSQVVAAQLDLEPLLTLYPPTHAAGALPKYPAIERDLSVVVDEATPWQSIADAVVQTNPAMLESTRFVGTYRGKQVGAGKKSVTLRMQFRDPETTLRHEQVDPQVAAVVQALGAKVGAELRA